jgi:hypothetical protein
MKVDAPREPASALGRCKRRVGPNRLCTLAFLGFTAGAFSAGQASAAPDDSRRPDLKEARAIFVQAERDEDNERWRDAYDKLQTVARMKATAGVRYHLALCEKHLGLLADALADFSRAEADARTENAADVLRLVGRELDELRLRVPRLAIHLPRNVQQVRVTLDGRVLSSDELGSPLPVNPGPHEVAAWAPEHGSTHESVTVVEHASIAISVPIEPSTTDAATPPATAGRSRESLSAARATSLALATGALVLAGAGVAAFVTAGAVHARAVDECANVTSRAPGACDSQKNAVRAWDWVAATAWAGTAAAGTGAACLWMGARRATAVILRPTGLAIMGTF